MRIDCEKFKKFVIDNGYKLRANKFVYYVDFGPFSIFVPFVDWSGGHYNGEKDNLNIQFYREDTEEYDSVDELMPEDGINFLHDLMVRFGGY